MQAENSGEKRRGRPSSYKPEYCESILEYFERPREDREALEKITEDSGGNGGKGSAKREVRAICAELPTIEGWIAEIGTCSSVVADWARKFPEFRVARDMAKDIQCKLLTDRMLTGLYNPQAAIFIAKNITWMRDRQELTGADGGPLSLTAVPPQLAALDDDKLQQIQQWIAEKQTKQIEGGQIVE